MAEADARRPQRLVVALVRGVHGLRGAVRVEVLTDRPSSASRPAPSCYREGIGRPADDRLGRGGRRRPGLALRFREIATREAADTLRGAYLETGRAPGRRPGARRGLLARGRRRRRSAASTAPSSASSRTSTGSPRTRSTSSRGGPYGDVRRARPSARSSGSSRRARGEIVVDAEALDLRPPPRRDADADRAARRHAGPAPPGTRRGARRAAEATGADPRPTGPSHDARDRRPDALPGDGRGPARGEHPRPDPGAGPRDGPDPRPARVRPGAAPVGRRHARTAAAPDGHAGRAGRRGDRVGPPARLDSSSCSTRAARCSARHGPPTSPARPTSSSSAPRYEGVDERVRALVDLELSIGDYVLTGGELPALVVIDAVIRLLPGRHRRRVDRRGVVQRRAARVPAVHPARRVPRPGRPGDPDLGRSRRGRALAPRAGARADARAPARTCSQPTS